jgi:hypothetical protein
MAVAYPTKFTPRRRVTLAIPADPDPWDYGLEAATLTVRTDQDLDAVVISVPAAGLELLLSVHATLDLLLRLVSATDALSRRIEL